MVTTQLTAETHQALQDRKRSMNARSIDAVIQELLAPRPHKETVLARLRSVAPALLGFGVRRLRLFGSVATDTARPGSDIDMIVDLEGDRDYVDLARVQRFMETVLGAKCDLVLPRALHPNLEAGIMAQAMEVDLD